MASQKEVTLERAIQSITQAAEEFKPEDFINYSTILDVHLSHALQEFTPEDQKALLEAVEKVLTAHPDLAREIAWDLLSVLLPFLNSPATAEIAERLIGSIASHGNPREVFIKTLEALTRIPWAPEEPENDDDGNDDEVHHSDDEESPTKVADHADEEKKQQELKIRTVSNAVKRFDVLISALITIHPRIASRVPSRFLSSELTALLSTFVKAVDVVDRDAATGMAGRLIEFIKVVHPKLAGRPGKKRASTSRPPLPPRVSTAETIKAPTQEKSTADEGEEPEALIQARLASSFLAHILEQYLLSTQKPHLLPSSGEHHDMPGFGPEDRVDRGLDIGWSGKYDDEVLRPNSSRVPGGKTLIDADRAQRAAQTNVWETVDEISTMCEALGLGTIELLELCQAQADGPQVDDNASEDGSDVGAPSSASDIPLSHHGALFLLAHRLSTSPSSAPSDKPLHIFPEHSNIASSFMIYRPGQTQPAVVDAILFLGAFMLDSGGLGDIPDQVEPFMMYLQIFAVISTNAKSPQQRWLGHHHVQRCLRAHPNEAVRLAYIKDTLEHCPFESLKAAIIGVLKDEILHACTPVVNEDDSVPSTPISIFGTPLVLQDIFDVLFIDLATKFPAPQKDDDETWSAFTDLYARLSATVNLLRFLYLSENVRERVGISEKGMARKVQERFLGPLKAQVGAFRSGKREEGAMECEVLWETVERVEEVRGRFVELD